MTVRSHSGPARLVARIVWLTVKRGCSKYPFAKLTAIFLGKHFGDVLLSFIEHISRSDVVLLSMVVQLRTMVAKPMIFATLTAD